MIQLPLTPQEFDFIANLLAITDPQGIYRPKELTQRMNETIVARRKEQDDLSSNPKEGKKTEK